MLTVKNEFLKKMIAHSRKEFPNEVCGIMAGKNGKVIKVYEMNNIDASPFTFFMDPKEQFKVMKEIRGLEMEMIGIYHSHVASQAYPSSHDVELAFYPNVLCTIISLQDTKNPVIKSFKIYEGKIKEEEVSIE